MILDPKELKLDLVYLETYKNWFKKIYNDREFEG